MPDWKPYLILLTAFGLYQAHDAASQPVYELDPLEAVTPPIIEESRLSPMAKVDVVSDAVLDTLAAGDLTAALRRVPGVTVSRYNRVGAYGGSDGGAVFIRGHGSGRPGADIATMIDGVPLFVGVWTHPLIDTLSVDLASSIEVYKSPQAARLGSMGFGAVNIVPKSATVEGFHGELEGSYGADETYLARFEAAFRQGNAGGFLAASHRQSDGHRPNADGEVQALYGNFAWDLTDAWTASFLVSVTDSWAHDPEPVGVSLPIVERYETENRFYLAKLQYESEAYAFVLKTHYEDGAGDWRQWHAPPPPPFPAQQLDTLTEYDNYGLKSSLSGTFANGFGWELGLDWDRFGGAVDEAFKMGPLNVFEELHFEIAAPHLQMSQSLGDRDSGGEFTATAAFRYLDHSVFEDRLAAQAGLSWKRGPIESYLQFAEATNYPGVFVSVFGRRPPPWQVGEDWRALEPESITHYEVGLRAHANDHITVNLSLFRDDVSDALRLLPPPPAGFIQNLGDYRIQGLETMAHLRWEEWTFFGGATWLDGDQDLPALPSWSASFGLNWGRDGWLLSADHQYVGDQLYLNPRFATSPQEIGSYQILSGRLAYRFGWSQATTETRPLEIYLHGENLLDEDYEYRPGYPMPGTTLTLGAKLMW